MRQDGVFQVENAFCQLPARYAKTEVRLIIRPHAVEVYSGDRFVQTFSKDTGQKPFEILDSESTFGASDPSLPSPAALHRSLEACGKAAGAGQASAAPSMNAEAAPDASRGASPAPSAGKAPQKRPDLSGDEEEPSAGSRRAQAPFIRDLSEYQRFSGGFAICRVM